MRKFKNWNQVKIALLELKPNTKGVLFVHYRDLSSFKRSIKAISELDKYLNDNNIHISISPVEHMPLLKEEEWADAWYRGEEASEEITHAKT